MFFIPLLPGGMAGSHGNLRFVAILSPRKDRAHPLLGCRCPNDSQVRQRLGGVEIREGGRGSIWDWNSQLPRPTVTQEQNLSAGASPKGQAYEAFTLQSNKAKRVPQQ